LSTTGLQCVTCWTGASPSHFFSLLCLPGLSELNRDYSSASRPRGVPSPRVSSSPQFFLPVFKRQLHWDFLTPHIPMCLPPLFVKSHYVLVIQEHFFLSSPSFPLLPFLLPPTAFLLHRPRNRRIFRQLPASLRFLLIGRPLPLNTPGFPQCR